MAQVLHINIHVKYFEQINTINMRKKKALLLGLMVFPLCLFAQEKSDSISSEWEKEFELNEVVVVASRPVIKQAPDNGSNS